MGSAYYITLDNKDPGFDIMVNGKFISTHSKQVNAIAKRLELKDIDSYFSQSPEDAKAAAEEFGADIDGIELPNEVFYPASEGIRWVTAIINDVQSAKPKGYGDILSDLEEYLSVFKQAEKINAKWHFSIDY